MWQDQYPIHTGDFVGWNTRAIPCPNAGRVSVLDTDWPGLPLGSAAFQNATRVLRFRIRVHSGEGCNCPHPSVTVTARQVLQLRDGRANERLQDFYTPNTRDPG